jgi:hypothetical protein
LIPIVSELLVCGDGVGAQTMTMRDFARTELAVITRAWATLRSQGGEMGMRVVGGAGRSGVEGVGGGRGMSILPHRFNPGVGLSQVRPPTQDCDLRGGFFWTDADGSDGGCVYGGEE